MKALISSFKSWFILILSGMLVLMLVFACSSPPEQGSSSTGRTSSGGDDGDDDKDLSCSLPECSGGDCCDKGSAKRKEDCEDLCDDLNLDSDGDEVCLTLEHDFLKNTLVFLFDNKEVLAKPDDKNLVDNIKDEDIGYICGAVKELGSRVWSRLIESKSYGRPESQAVLGWVAKEKQAVEIFKNAEEEEGIKMLKVLLRKAHGDSGDEGVLKGLGVRFEWNNDDNNDYTILKRSIKNAALLTYIHEEVLENKEEGICGEDATSNLPEPDCGTDKYPRAGCDENGEATRQKERACILGVYCKVAPDDIDRDNDLREDIASKLKDGSIKSFIERDIADGGLGLEEQVADDWAHSVCVKLKQLWNNNDGGGFDLGLTES